MGRATRIPSYVSHLAGHPVPQEGGEDDTERTARARGVSPGEPGESHAARFSVYLTLTGRLHWRGAPAVAGIRVARERKSLRNTLEKSHIHREKPMNIVRIRMTFAVALVLVMSGDRPLGRRRRGRAGSRCREGSMVTRPHHRQGGDRARVWRDIDLFVCLNRRNYRPLCYWQLCGLSS